LDFKNFSAGRIDHVFKPPLKRKAAKNRRTP
jgi:hypothetical protein